MIIFLLYKHCSLKNNIKKLNIDLESKIKNENNTKIANNTSDRNFNKLADNIEILIKKNRENIVLKNQIEKDYKDLMANLSHDLRTPLTSIIGYISLINTDDEDSKKYIKIIGEKSTYLNNLIEKFYEFSLLSGIDNSSEELNYLDLKEMLYSIVFEYYSGFENLNQNIEINFNNDNSLEVLSSSKLLSTVFHNIIDNILKYSLGDNLIELEESENYIKIFFSNKTNLDDGNYNFLFNRGRVIDSSRKYSTGIGLAIVSVAINKLEYMGNIFVKDKRFYIEITIIKNTPKVKYT